MIGEAKNCESKVVDLNAYREKKSEDISRRFERHFLSRETSAVLCLPSGVESPIAIVQVSEEGLLFHISLHDATLVPLDLAKPILIRLFLTPTTHLDLPALIAHGFAAKNAYFVGCQIPPSGPAFEAYRAWLAFTRAYFKCGRSNVGGPEAA